MNYHVHFQGKDLGILSLDELRQMRLDGRMTGLESVWKDGMSEWQRLDEVLGIPLKAASSPRGNRWLIAGIVAASVAFICLLAFFLYVAHSVFHNFQAGGTQVLQNALTASHGGEAGVDVASRPIAQNTNSPCQADVWKSGKAFRLRQYLDAYQKQGAHDQPWDSDAKLLIRGWIDSYYGDYTSDQPNLVGLGNKLSADPSCKDAIVLLAAGATSPEIFEARHRFERAVAAFADSKYKGYPRFFATLSLANNLQKEPARVAQLDQSALLLLKESLSDGSLLEKDQPEMEEILYGGWAKSFFTRHPEEICSIVDQSGTSFRWLASMLKGWRENTLAWKARGGGYANTVTQAGWQGFHDHSVKAEEFFTAAWNLHPEWPQSASFMEYTVLGEEGADQVRQWFDRATTAQIDYAPAWQNLRWALRPRWYGSHAALIALGVSAIDSGRFDTDVPRQFFDCVKEVESDSDILPGQHIYGRPDIWPEMKRMYEGYIAEPSQARYATGWRGSYAIVAYFAKHYDTALEQLEKLDWWLSPAKLSDWGKDLSLLPLEVAARTGTQAQAVAEAEDAFEQERVEEALRQYQKLATAAQDNRTQRFIQHRLASLPLEQRLQKGEWIDFLPTATNDLNWTLARGRCDILPDGAVEVQSGPEGSMLYSRVRVGVDFEIKGEFEVVHSSTKDFQAGIVAGLPDLNTSEWYAFLIKRNANEGDVAALARGWSLAGSVIRPATLNDSRNSFDFRFHNGEATANVNSKNVLIRAARPGAVHVCDNQFLLGWGPITT
jgi:hypothetical protein